MPDTTQLMASGAGIAGGVGSTLLMRRQFDRQGETTLLRPSVLWGLGTGAAAMTVPMLMPSLARGMTGELLEDYGEAAIAAGTMSAFSPKGGGVALPSL